MNANGTPVTGQMVDDGAATVQPEDGLGAAAGSLLGHTPATNAIRARFRGNDNKLGVAMIAHANDMERRLHAIAGSIECLQPEWVTQQSELFQEFVACIRRNATLPANDQDQTPRTQDHE